MMINFDKKLEVFTREWFAKNSKKFKTAEELENKAAEIYMMWANTADTELAETPAAYVHKIPTQKLAELMANAFESFTSIPSIITDELALREDREAYLIEYIRPGKNTELTATAINLLSNDPTEELFEIYFNWLTDKDIEDELLENVFDALAENADKVKEGLLKIVDVVAPNRLDYICDVFSNLTEKDDRVYDLLIKRLRTGENFMFYCACISKYGDKRAVKILKELAKTCDYAGFLEIHSALTAMGEDIECMRDFSEDETFIEITKKLKKQ